ncbi:(R)-mandelonitrile lyase [Pedobacter sp.]|jgi:quercetin dioxygenase-like cupin family protein|uniref:(R)-mandelonitrile lyase n=1 Tax=Pedobacter sp. TaxID=1411316 RepID=UPI002BE3D6E5|nr:cupin domain-containing protein [Pedobacter sp.]HWW38041.1 cupin domain-containing protein [Pedobacter sp.]
MKDLILKEIIDNTLKKLKPMLLVISLTILTTACNNHKNENKMSAENNSSIFPLGNPGSSDWFSGEVHVQTLVTPQQMENLYNVGQVTFSPRGRTHWHTHPIGQVLLITEGKGWYQERGKPAQKLTKGSTVAIPKGVEHWHGAAADSKMVHIAISNMLNGNNVTWTTPVTDDEYAAVNK